MRYKALIGFAGADISAFQGQEIEIDDKKVADSLIDIAYIEALEEEKEEKEEKPKSKRGKKNED